MSSKKIKCDSGLCRYCSNGTCSFEPSIKNGECINFAKNLAYYIVQFGVAMGHSKMLPFYNLKEEAKIGAYYAMKVYNLGMKTFTYGNWEWLEFSGIEDETRTALNFNAIVERPANTEEFIRLQGLLYDGQLPPFEDEQEEINQKTKEKDKEVEKIKTENPDIEEHDYGFVDTEGKFYPADFGDHTELAYNIIEANEEWYEEFRKSEYSGHPVDFLVNVKYWILIHNPWGYGKVQIQTSQVRMPSKAQIDFLYNYHIVREDYGSADQILQEYSF